MAVSRPWSIVVDTGSLEQTDLGTIDVLLRLQLGAKRGGGELLLRHAGEELRELIELAGLAEVLRVEVLAVEAGGQAEAGEEPLCIQEERELGDPAG